jgi:acyl carrier protein
MNDEIRSRSAKVLSLALGKPVEPTSNPSKSFSAEWDSLKHIELILMLEEEFKIRFSAKEVNVISSLDDIVRQVMLKNES